MMLSHKNHPLIRMKNIGKYCKPALDDQHLIQQNNVKDTLSKCSLTDNDCPKKDTPVIIKKVTINVENP